MKFHFLSLCCSTLIAPTDILGWIIITIGNSEEKEEEEGREVGGICRTMLNAIDTVIEAEINLL